MNRDQITNILAGVITAGLALVVFAALVWVAAKIIQAI